MERIIFQKKISLLNPLMDKEIKDVLSLVFSRNDKTEVFGKLRKLFISIYASLCHQEGVESLKSLDEEMALKDRVPDTIANWLTVLSEIFSGASSMQRVLDPLETSAILILKLREWSALNYEGRFLYGDAIETDAVKRFNELETEMDLLGDKDEILTLVLDSLKGFCADYWIDEKELIPGVKTYFVDVRFNYGQGDRSIAIGLKSMAFDHVKLRAYSKDQHILAHIFESLTVLSHIGNSQPDNYI